MAKQTLEKLEARLGELLEARAEQARQYISMTGKKRDELTQARSALLAELDMLPLAIGQAAEEAFITTWQKKAKETKAIEEKAGKIKAEIKGLQQRRLEINKELGGRGISPESRFDPDDTSDAADLAAERARLNTQITELRGEILDIRATSRQYEHEARQVGIALHDSTTWRSRTIEAGREAEARARQRIAEAAEAPELLRLAAA